MADAEGLVVFALEGVDRLGEADLAGLLLDAFDQKGSESGEAALGEDGEGFDDEAGLVRVAEDEADELTVLFGEEGAVGNQMGLEGEILHQEC